MKSINNKIFLSCLLSFVTGFIAGMAVKGFASEELKTVTITCFSLLFQVMVRLFQLFFTIYLFLSLVVLFYCPGKNPVIPFVCFLVLSSMLYAMVLFDIEHLFYDSFSFGRSGTRIEPLSFVESVIPKSLFDALACNNGLQVLIFSIFFGSAAKAVKARSLMRQMQLLNKVIIKLSVKLSWLFAFASFVFAFLVMLKFR